MNLGLVCVANIAFKTPFAVHGYDGLATLTSLGEPFFAKRLYHRRQVLHPRKVIA